MLPRDPPIQLDTPLAGHGRYPKSVRIRNRQEFDLIHKKGIRVHRPLFTVVCARSLIGRTHGARFGCAVSRKVGNSVVRGRLKRLMREVFRLSRSSLPSVDIVTILKPGADVFASKGMQAFADELLPAWREASDRALKAGDSPRRKRTKRATHKRDIERK